MGILQSIESLISTKVWRKGEFTLSPELGGASGKDLPANARDIRDGSSTPRSARSPGGGHGNPLFLPGESHGQTSLAGYSP